MTTVRRHVRSWSPPTPTLETAHDVRRLRVCERCGALGSDLLRLRSLFQDRKAFAHTYCLISKQRDGWEVFVFLHNIWQWVHHCTKRGRQ